MPTNETRAPQQSSGKSFEAALARCSGPAWVIDPGKGQVLSANAAGATRFGLRPDAPSGTLDAAMPGLVRLRAIVREVLNGGRREPLVFWTAYGAENLLCNVSAVGDPSAHPLVLVALAGADSDEKPAIKRAKPDDVGANDDDAATLQKIAHAIRTGFGKPKGESQTSDLELSEEASDDPEPKTPPLETVERRADLSQLAHELRTPLSAIMAAAEIMKDERFGKITNARYRGYIVDIHDNARHALEVIARLLSGDVTEALEGTTDPAELNLNTIAKSCVSAMRPLADGAKLTLKKELHAKLPHVVADAMTVKQIIFNLLANALKFTKPGGNVRVVTGLGFKESVFIAVRDTGLGMSDAEISRALDGKVIPVPNPNEKGGLGIGLHLANKLAKANGARLEIDSVRDEGTTVALVFPENLVVSR